MEPIKEYTDGRTFEVTDCCNVPFSYGGNYGQFYRKCPKCGAGQIYWDVPTHFVYQPSSLEEELIRRVENLERQGTYLK